MKSNTITTKKGFLKLGSAQKITIISMILIILISGQIFACETWKAEEGKSYHGNMIGYSNIMYDDNLMTFITFMDDEGNTHDQWWYLEQNQIELYFSYDYFWEYNAVGDLDNMQVVSIDRAGNEVLIEDY